MNRVAIGPALGEGFSLIRRKPLTVLSWGLAQAVVAATAWTLYLPFYLQMLGQIGARASGAGAGAAPDPALMGQMMQMQGFSMLLSFASMAVSIVVYCAAFRAVLFPEQRQWAYLRVGVAELLLGVAAIAGYIGFTVALLVVVLPTAVVVGILSATHQVEIGVLIAFLVGIAAFVATIYVILRLCLLGPLTVRDGALRLSDAWALTKGHVGALFAILACQVVCILVFEVLFILILFLVGAAALGATGGLQGLQAFMRHPTPVSPGAVIPWIVVIAVLLVPISGGLVAFLAAPWARVLRDLTHSDALEAFA